LEINIRDFKTIKEQLEKLVEKHKLHYSTGVYYEGVVLEIIEGEFIPDEIKQFIEKYNVKKVLFT